MRIELKDIAKKYHRSNLFQNLDYEFESGKSYAILGANGSGKSTLLRIIAGYTSPTAGKIFWAVPGKEKAIELKEYHQYFSYSSPALELFDELTLKEHLQMHFKLKKIAEGKSVNDLIELAGFKGHENKTLKHFSSGMLQRVKLLMALFTSDKVVLLDEPCTNLDEKGVAWYRQAVLEQKGKKLLIIASNQAQEYDFCEEELRIGNSAESGS